MESTLRGGDDQAWAQSLYLRLQVDACSDEGDRGAPARDGHRGTGLGIHGAGHPWPTVFGSSRRAAGPCCGLVGRLRPWLAPEAVADPPIRRCCRMTWLPNRPIRLARRPLD